MKVILFGLGSIGMRHAQILKGNFPHDLFAFRTQRRPKGNSLNIRELYNWEEVERLKPEVAFITNPTYLHVETALRCASLGMHLFIEKPLGSSLEKLDDLESKCKDKNLTCYVAYCLRFHPVINQIKQECREKEIYHVRIVCSSYLPRWRKDFDVQESYSASDEKGGGVILDLSHEFDYIQYLFGEIKDIQGRYDRVSAVTLDSEDFADVLITTEAGVRVNLHLNFFSHWNERAITVDFKDGYLRGDLLANQITYGDKDKKETRDCPIERNEFFLAQTKYFFDNLNNPGLMNNLNEARKLLEKILVFKDGKRENSFNHSR